MILIFEGCDCTGKSSIIEELKRTLPSDTQYKHFSSPPKNLSTKGQYLWCKMEYFNELSFQKEFNTMNFVYDRFYFGEQIYAPKYRGYSPDYIPQIEKELNRSGAYLILVTATPEIVKKRFDGVFIEESHIEDLLYSYNQAFKSSKIKRKITLDSSIKNPRELVDQLWGEINGYKRELFEDGE